MHSPAPWAITDRTKDGHSKITAAGLSGLVCVVGNGEVRPEQAQANAKLIAAAPDLLAFAEAFIARWNLEDDAKPVSEIRPMAQAAIAKATL